MKKTIKKNVVITAVLAIMLCISLIAGATFALFTSESQVNIAVTSGKVDVRATIANFSVSHPENVSESGMSNYAQGFFAGDARCEENVITLSNMVPGDKVTFDVVITNYSTVPVKFKTEYSAEGDSELINALDINVGATTGWARLDAATGNNGTVVNTVNCYIEMPYGCTAQDKECSIAFVVKAVQGNAEVDNMDDSVLYISNAQELIDFAESVDFSAGYQDYEGKTVYLTNDIYLTGTNFKGIGHDKHVEDYFMGTFDGQGHTVYGIDFTNDECPGVGHEACWEDAERDGGFSTAGFFNNLGGTVKNLTISGAKITSAHYAGGIAAYCVNGAKIENCHVIDSEITSYTKEYNGKFVDGDKVGGIAGMVLGSTIDNCTVENTTIKAYRDISALVGCATGNSSTISNCQIEDVTIIVDRTHNYNNYKATAEAHFVNDYIGHNYAAVVDNCTGNATIICADYYVASANDMMALLSRTDVKTVAFINDIDMSGKAWTGLSGLDLGSEGLTIIGNGHSISNLSAPLVIEAINAFAVDGLTIKDSTMMQIIGHSTSESYGFGAFLQVMRAGTITLSNCHVENVKLQTGADTRVGGLVGVVYGVANISNCSVYDCKLSAFGTIGGLAAYIYSTNYNTQINNCSVKNTIISSSDDGNWRIGTLIGTIEAKIYVNSYTSQGNTLTQANANTDNPNHDIFGRFASVGKLYVDGGEFIANGLILKNGEYQISTAEGLVYCATTWTTSDNTINKKFALMNDIDMSGIEWTPWCNDQQYFNGLFDGNNHEIQNLTIEDDAIAGGHATGFIGRLGANALGEKTLQNVKFVNANVSGHHWVGVAVGYNEYGYVYNVQVSDSHVVNTHDNNGVVNGEQIACGDKTGAVIGFVGASAANDCVNNCKAINCTVEGCRDAGQIVGGAKIAQVNNCTVNSVSVSRTTQGDTCTDGSASNNIREEIIGRVLQA